MSEIQRTEVGTADGVVGADRDAKIEQLLLVGLDHYFSAQYEEAINVWTRALFVDRSHARARAYIERARSAQAERQRESEELLQTGVAAFQRGEAEEARRLLQAAIDGGAPAEEALVILDRLNRLPPAAPLPGTPVRPDPRTQPVPASTGRDRPRSGLFLAVAITGGLSVALVLAAAATGRIELRLPFELSPAPAPITAPIAQELALPLVHRADMALGRARLLAAGGHLRDALSALDDVRPTDSEKEEADRLRADLQRELLALTPIPPPPAPVQSPRPNR